MLMATPKKKVKSQVPIPKPQDFNAFSVVQKYFPIKLYHLQKIVYLFSQKDLNYYRINYHNVYNSNYIEESHFVSIDRNTLDLKEI